MPRVMKLQILAFGIARDIMGGSSLQLPVNDVTTAGELKQELLRQYPALRTAGSLMIAVNSSYAADADPVKPTDEIAVIPPVSGG